MTGVLLALTLGATAPLWAGTKGFDSTSCDSTALAAALHAQRPSVSVHTWDPDASPAGSGIRVRLVRADGATHLDVTGAGAPISRVLPPVDDCKRDVEIAALIVDNALDELSVSEAPEVGSLAAPVPLRSRVEVGVAVGAGVEQGPFGVVGALDVSGVARYRFLELTLDADAGLPSSSTVPNSPEAGSSDVSATSLGLELGLGLAPRLGPGRASLDALLGLSLTFASASPVGSGATLFQSASQVVHEGFAGLRVGYLLDLPHRFYVGAHAEERFAPGQTSFGVVQAEGTSATTRQWIVQALGLVGYRFL